MFNLSNFLGSLQMESALSCLFLIKCLAEKKNTYLSISRGNGIFSTSPPISLSFSAVESGGYHSATSQQNTGPFFLSGSAPLISAAYGAPVRG